MPNTNTPTKPVAPQSNEPIYVDREDGVVVIEGLIKDAIAQNNMEDLRDIVDTLKNLLAGVKATFEKNNPALFARQQKNLARAQWHVMSRMRTEEVENLFRHHFQFFFDYPLKDILESLHVVLLTVADYSERDLFKQQLRDAMSQSQVHVGETKITVTGVLMDPTLANWLRDWKDFLGERKPDSLMIVEYLNSNENIRLVPSEVREKVSAVLKLWVELLKSSETPEGLEDRVMVGDPYTGTYKMLENGQLRDIGVAVPKEELKELRNAYLLDENGKPLPLAERVKRLPGFDEIVKEVSASQKAAITKTASEPRTTTQNPAAPNVSAPKTATISTAIPKKSPVAGNQPTGEVLRSIPGLPPLMPVSKPALPPIPPLPQPTPQPAPRVAQPAKEQLVKKDRDPHEMAEQVLGEYKLLFPSADIERRFLSLLVSYFNDVRDRMETREALIRVPEEGGVGLMAAKADNILQTADDVASGKMSLPQIAPRKKAQQAPVFKPKLEDVMKMTEQKKQYEPKKPVEVEDIFSSMSPIFETPQTAQPVPAVSPVAALNRSQKKVVHDITPSSPAQRAPAVMGPLDELRAMNVDEFHRVSPNSQTAAKHIYDKIQLLEAESIEKKAQGITAWQQSPLNQLYIAIGNESLEKSIAVGDVIQQRSMAKQLNLTQEEFAAISDLNRKLRF